MSVRENLFLARLKITNYLWELFLALVSFGLTYFTFWLYSTSNFRYRLGEDYAALSSPAIRFVVWIIIFLCIKQLSSWFSVIFIKRGRLYRFNFQDWSARWIFQGGIVVKSSPSRLVVKQSNSGCLLRSYVWKDFEMTFEMRFCEGASEALGILFRAEDLENYFMLQISHYSQDGKLRIIPHIRIFGNWEVLGEQPLLIERGLDLDAWFSVRLQAQKNIAKLFIDDTLIYEWILPTHVEPNLRQHAGEGSETRGEAGKEPIGNVPKVPFRVRYGMVGFRAFPGEQTEIRGLEIKKL